jgi:integrase/recombinase XerD
MDSAKGADSMLAVYSRHYPPCPSSDLNYKRCRCPKWINGVLGSDGPFIRRSAKTRSWEKAEDFKRKLEEEYEAKEKGLEEASRTAPALVTVNEAVARFLSSKRNENLADSTLDKLTTIFEKQFFGWTTSAGFTHITEITTADLEGFRDTWTDGPLAKKKKQERLIGFFYYCFRLGWIKSNPAVLLGRIRADGPPTDYFPKHEFNKIMDATYIYQPKGWVECRNQATRLRILTLLMRWSGLAIRDAVTLERRRLNEKDELFLYRAKTGNPVYVPLPSDVAEALREIPPGPTPNPRYFFWSGNGSPKSVVGNWQRSFRRLFKIANLRGDDGSPKRCHPHMLRDTFAVEMLLAGVPLEQVSILLGHKSVKITEKHYAPWVKARQEQLAANVRKAWSVLDTGNKTTRGKSPKGVKSA